MNILLIEDDAGLVELITGNLEELGFSVMSTASGAEALAHLKKQTPDLILLDYSLPDINGKELIETLNKQQTPLPPFIITTGQGDERIAVNMMKLGAKDYLIKDILFLEKLPDVVNRVIKEIESEGKLKLAEERLKISEQRSMAYLENSPACTKIVDLDFNLQYMSSAGIKGLNIDNIEEYYGKSYPLYFYPDSFKVPMTRNLKKAKETGEIITQEAPVVDVDGDELWFHSTIVPVKDDEGQLDYIMVVSIDTTKRKQAEQALKQSEEILKNTFDLSPSIISKANINTGYFIQVNQAVTRILGYSVEEFTSKPLLDFIHQDDRQKTKEELSKQQKGKETIFFENRYLCKDGSYKLMAWHCTKADKNGIVTAIGSDISERKEAEAVVKKLSTAVRQSPSIVVIADTEGKLEYVNPKFTESTGYSLSEVIGKKTNILKSGEQDSAFYKEMWEIIDSGKVWRGQFHNKKKNGELFWEAASISAILNESGDVINYIKIGEDITQQKITEEKLKIALEKALESDRLKSAFLANMSHEIRTPMNGILGFVNLLNEPNLSKSEIGKYSAIINRNGDRLLNTINDIIDISKIEAGQVVVSTSETSINTEIEEIYSFFLPEANKKGLSLSIESSPSTEQLRVITDSHKLHGILTNLIKNAIKYTEKGSITFGYFLKDKFIEFYVKDTGIGIPKDRMKAVFNRFEQADIEDRRVFEGSGLGLAISKAYVEMLGGEISVTSVESKGSTFTFTIPYNKEEKIEIEQIPENIDKDITSTGKLNLLIVEDDDISSELLRIILKDNFRKIIFAGNGIEAIEICKNRPEIDLVLMDINMPKMNGYDATKEIRKFNKDLFIIAQTAYGLSGDKEKAIEAGCNDYISKPINKDKLLVLIQKYFKK